MKLKSVIDAVNYQICDTNKYLWECFGPNARLMDFCDTNNNEIGSCVYDSATRQVYTVEAFSDDEDTHYTWVDKDYIAAYEQEAESRGVDLYIAYDVKKTTLVNKSTILSLLSLYANPKSKKSEYPNFATDQTCSTSYLKENANNLGENMASAEHNDNNDDDDYDDDDDVSRVRPSDATNNRQSSDSDSDKSDKFGYSFNKTSTANDEATKQNYEVVLNVKNRFTVTASSMEEAAKIATDLVDNNMRLTGWGDSVVWESKWVSKKTVSTK